MAVDGVLFANSSDVIILVTGDGDFVDLVNYLKMVGKRVEAICFHGTASTDLLNAVDQYSWAEQSWILAAKEEEGTSCAQV